MTGFAFAYAVVRVCGGQPRKNPGTPQWGNAMEDVRWLMEDKWKMGIVLIVSYRIWLVLLINQINHNFYHHVFLFRFTFSNHQGQGHEGVISQTLRAIFAIQDPLLFRNHKNSVAPIRLFELVQFLHRFQKLYFTKIIAGMIENRIATPHSNLG